MNIKIIEGIQQTKNLTDHVVVIDAFRASNTILAILEKGAEDIYIPSSNKQIDRLIREFPTSLYFGEVGGEQVDGADCDNSPSKAYKLNLEGRTIILSTSRGSRAVSSLKNAEKILIACFGNAKAVSAYLSKVSSKNITFVACGEEHGKRAIEDYECARYIQSLIEGKQTDYEQITSSIAKGTGANRLLRNGQLEDLNFCLNLDYSRIIPIARRRGNIVMVERYKPKKR